MRLGLIAAMVLASGAAAAQDGARIATLAEIRRHRDEWAGQFIRVEHVTISGFAPSKGGMATDASGAARLDHAGMPPETVRRLKRHCGEAQTGAACRGALEFTVTAVDEARKRFTIRDADFTQDD